MGKFSISLINTKRWYSLEDFKNEIWKDVVGYEGHYKVSNYGRVKSVARLSPNYSQPLKERILKIFSNGRGYWCLSLWINGNGKRKYIYRLVAEAFIPNPFNLPHINHKDENKDNNKVDNLEWCTPKYNNAYGTARFRLEKAREDNGNTTKIDMYDLNGTLLKHYDCAYDIDKDGISRRAAYNVCYGRSKSYKGCVFRFSGMPFSYEKDKNNEKGREKIITKSDANGNIIKTYASIKEAERDNGFGRNRIYSSTYAYTRTALIDGFYYNVQYNH